MVDVFELAATLRLDSNQFDKELDKSESKISKFGNGVNKVFSAVGSVAKVGAAGLAASFAAVSAVIGKSIKEYADYEQIWGGVQKLYGTAGQSIEEYAKSVGKSVGEVQGEYSNLEKAQQLMLKQANDGYKTSGLSAKDYMQQATGFSASLIKSLNGDTVEAARMTDVAMRAMSDNINTYGQDAESVQNAFQGFARENFTMLDNLRLGYGGSREGMLALIADANEYAKSIGMAGDLTIDSFADIVTAIDLIQQKQNIAGTTAREAATTISGSIGMLKASWDNLITGLANKDADITQLVSNVVESMQAVITNIAPVFETAANGLLQLIDNVIPLITSKLPGVINQFLPKLVQVAANLFVGLAKALPSLVSSLISMIPVIFNSIKQAIISASPQLIETGKLIVDGFKEFFSGDAVTDFAEMVAGIYEKVGEFLQEGLPTFMEYGGMILNTLLQGMATVIPSVLILATDIINGLVAGLSQQLPNIITAAGNIISGLVEGLMQAIPRILTAAVEIVTNLVQGIINALPNLIDAGMKIVNSINDGIKAVLPQIPAIIVNLVQNIVNIIMTTDWIGLGIKIIQFIANGIQNTFSLIPTLFKTIFDLAVQLVTQINWLELGSFVIRTIISGIQALASALWSLITSIFNNAVSIVTSIDWLGLGMKVIRFIANGVQALFSAIPSLLGQIANMAVSAVTSIDWLGLGTKVITFIVNGVKALINALPDALKSIAKNAFNAVKNIDWLGLGKAIIDGIVGGIKAVGNKIKDTLTGLAQGALDKAKSLLGISSPSKVFRDEVGKMIGLGMIEGINSTVPAVVKAMDELITIPEKIGFEKGIITTKDEEGIEVEENKVKAGDTYIININKEIATADEIARAIRTESQYGLIGGVSLG